MDTSAPADQCRGNGPLCYLLICQAHVTHPVNGLLCDDSEWPFKIEVIFHLPTPSPRRNEGPPRLVLQPCPRKPPTGEDYSDQGSGAQTLRLSFLQHRCLTAFLICFYFLKNSNFLNFSHSNSRFENACRKLCEFSHLTLTQELTLHYQSDFARQRETQ